MRIFIHKSVFMYNYLHVSIADHYVYTKEGAVAKVDE